MNILYLSIFIPKFKLFQKSLFFQIFEFFTHEFRNLYFGFFFYIFSFCYIIYSSSSKWNIIINFLQFINSLLFFFEFLNLKILNQKCFCSKSQCFTIEIILVKIITFSSFKVSTKYIFINISFFLHYVYGVCVNLTIFLTMRVNRQICFLNSIKQLVQRSFVCRWTKSSWLKIFKSQPPNLTLFV